MYKRFTLLTLLSAVFLLGAHTASATSYAGVTVRLETPDGTLFDQVVYISDNGCAVTDSGETEQVLTGFNAMCALDAAAQDIENGFTYELVDSIYGLYINGISEYVGGEDYWNIYLNLQSTSTGIAETIVADGDELLLTFGGYSDSTPLRIALGNSHVVSGTANIATVDYYSYEAGDYLPLVGVEVTAGDLTATTDENGEVSLIIDEPGTYLVQAVAEGYTRSAQAYLVVYPAYDEILQTVSNTLRVTRVEDAIGYLIAEESEGFLGGSEGNTEWAVQGIIAAQQAFDLGDSADELLADLKATVMAYHPKASDENAAPEIARHILTLEAMGVDSRNAEGINYVARLKKTMSDKQFGDPQLCNDDIFAGLALRAADEPFTSKAVRRAMRAALTCQNEDGGFGFSLSSDSDVDATAAWLMLAGEFKGHASAHHIELKAPRAAAFDYIRSAQHPDGGWGYIPEALSNSSSTAWALMAYQANDIQANDIKKNHLNGFDFLSSVQGKKGGIQYDTEKSYSIVELNTAYSLMTWAQTPIGQ